MFKKAEVPTATVSVPELTVAACGEANAIALVGDKVRLMYAVSVGFPVTVRDLPLPPGGRIVALGVAGSTSALVADGTLWAWTRNERWERVGNLLDVGTP